MVVFVMVGLSLAWVLTGPSFAFVPGSTHVTMAWIGLNLPMSLIAALTGGYVTNRVARDPSLLPVKVLAGIVLGMGLIMAVAHAFSDPSVDQQAAQSLAIEGMSAFEAASEAVQPVWYNFLIPFIGAVGVFLGGRLGSREADQN